jgi:guanine deaminase
VQCDYYPAGMLVVTGEQITDILSEADGRVKYRQQLRQNNTTDLRGQVIMPAFFDMHFHWVQDDVREMPKDSLLEWLEKYTFPAETKFGQAGYARKKARSFFRKLAATGTLGGACYSSIHADALEAAMAQARGDFVIGNVLMNMNSPVTLTQTEQESLSLVRQGIKKYGHRYCLTPRFAISTTPGVMKQGSALADRAGCFKQTHLSETPGEIEFVLSIYRGLKGFEKVRSYTEIYEQSGMLGPRSLMGHGIHLSPRELKLLSKTATSLIHCPTSNAPIKELGLGSGLFDFRKVEKAKVRWALGSDIGGGPFLSMFDVMNSFVKQNHKRGIKEATFIKALFRATLMGAKILGVAERTGNLDQGKEASFIVVPLPGPRLVRSPEKLLKEISATGRSERTCFDTLVSQTFLRGKLIYHRK